MKIIEQKIEDIITPSLKPLGYEIVRVKLMDGTSRGTKLQIMAELSDGETVTLEDCEKISRTVSALLDVADPLNDAYVLEVSSPGIDRPLMKLADYDRFKGFVAKIQLVVPIDGRRKFQGKLLGIEGENVKLKQDDFPEAFVLPYSQIDTGKLVLTDELIKHTLQQQEKKQQPIAN